MPNMTIAIGQVAGTLTFAAFVAYIIAILYKNTRPNRATWIIWAAVSGVITASSYASGARETVWVPLCDTIGAFIIVILSFKYGESKWTRLDRWCLASAGISALLWWWYNSPLIALYANITIDLIGALPTIWKSYREPDGEDQTTWTLFFLASMANMFAIDSWTFAIALYPVSQIISIGPIAILVFWHRKRLVFKPIEKKPISMFQTLASDMVAEIGVSLIMALLPKLGQQKNKQD